MLSHPPFNLRNAEKALSQRIALYVMLLATAVLLRRSWQARHFQLDDAMIYMRYFQNCLTGKGLVYNEGVYFNGLTSPAYTYLMLAVGWLVGNLQHAAVVVSTLGLAAAAWLLFAWSSRQGFGLGAALGLLIAVALPFLYMSYGMESALFLALIAACLWYYQQANYFALALAGALLVLTRTEGVFLLLALLLEHVLAKRPWPGWRVLLLPVVLLAVHYLFNRYYYGAFVPETASAKIWQGKSGLWGEAWPLFLRTPAMLDMAFSGKQALLVLLGLAGAAGIVLRWRALRPALLFALGYTAFFCVLNIPAYHWYYAPLFLLFCWSAGIGVVACLERLPGLGVGGMRLAHAGLALSFAGLAGAIVMRIPVLDHAYDAYQETGLWLKANTAPTAKVAMVEIGVAGFYSDRYIIDILGLVNPNNARYIGERRFEQWLQDYHPDYFFVHAPFWANEIAVQHLVARGEAWERADYNVPGYRLFCRKGLEGCRPIDDKSPRVDLSVIVMDSDKLPEHTTKQAQGSINTVQVTENHVFVRGRGAFGAQPLRQLVVSMPVARAFSRLSGISSDGSFLVEFVFRTSQEAQTAGANLCVAAKEEDGQFALLGPLRAPCDRLLKR